MKKNIVLIIILFLSLAACVSDNPRQGGFFGGLAGIGSGAYDNRVQQRQNELSDQHAANTKLKQESNALGSEIQLKQRELESEYQSVALMEKDLTRLETDVGRINATSSQQKTELSSLQLKINDLNRSMKLQQSSYVQLIHDGGCNTNAVRCQVLEKERNRLEHEYKKLVDYHQALSKAVN